MTRLESLPPREAIFIEPMRRRLSWFHCRAELSNPPVIPRLPHRPIRERSDAKLHPQRGLRASAERRRVLVAQSRRKVVCKRVRNQAPDMPTVTFPGPGELVRARLLRDPGHIYRGGAIPLLPGL